MIGLSLSLQILSLALVMPHPYVVTLRWIDLIHPLDVGLIKTTTTPKITSPEQGKFGPICLAGR